MHGFLALLFESQKCQKSPIHLAVNSHASRKFLNLVQVAEIDRECRARQTSRSGMTLIRERSIDRQTVYDININKSNVP